MKGQSQLQSWLEVFANIAIGYGINLSAQVFIYPWFGIHISLRENLYIGLCFTVISIVRSYVLRRAFNRFHVWQARR